VTGGESFTATTKVLLADGKAVPISTLKPGEKVLATNTKTGKNQAETITAVMVRDDHDLYDLKVRAGGRTAVIDTTRNHLFWDPGTRRWIKAAALKYGTHLRTPSGGTATDLGGRTPSNQSGWMWDLTIPGDHDFYIDTLAASVLVHNCPTLDDLSASGCQPDPADAGGKLTRAGRAFAKHTNLFPQVTGGPSALNAAGQGALDEILTNPGTVQQSVTAGNFAGGLRFIAPNGIGGVFDSAGIFQYFGRFMYP
jgi:hypothetical protein